MDDFSHAEACLERLVTVVREELGLDAAAEPGTGAAGGLGYGLRIFLNARLEPGFALFARYARLHERIKAADVVVTGEGAIDRSTLMGKGVGEIAKACRAQGKLCLGLAGQLGPLEATDLTQSGFARLYGMTPHLTSPAKALAEPGVWLPRLASRAAAESLFSE